MSQTVESINVAIMISMRADCFLRKDDGFGKLITKLERALAVDALGNTEVVK